MNSQQLKKTAITAIVCFAAAACLARAATYTSPRQLALNDVYQINVDYASGDEATTEHKTDANDGVGGDNPYYRRTNVARAHVGG